SKSKAGTIAGSVVGGVAFFALIALGLLLYHRRRTRNSIGLDINQKEPIRFAMFRSKRERVFPSSQSFNINQPDPSLHREKAELFQNPTPRPRARLSLRKLPLANNNFDNSTELSSVTAASSSMWSADAAAELREEMENLRREMEEMRVSGQYEPPPEYQ
ncbi:hypothetical protein GYMLUDRAFT_1027445, partial [Collybiopsis luxurians FD-317 M1]